MTPQFLKYLDWTDSNTDKKIIILTLEIELLRLVSFSQRNVDRYRFNPNLITATFNQCH